MDFRSELWHERSGSNMAVRFTTRWHVGIDESAYCPIDIAQTESRRIILIAGRQMIRQHDIDDSYKKNHEYR